MNESKYFQTITDENGVSHTYEWSLKKLRESVCTATAINNYYLALAKRGVLWIAQHGGEGFADNLPGEKWKRCPLFSDDVVEASNMGRIKINGQIAELREKAAVNRPLGVDVLCDKDVSVGWLVPFYAGAKYGDEYVYAIVAAAWLGPRPKGYITHHISDDGYDNRPCNLIYLPGDVHQKEISPRGVSGEYNLDALYDTMK